MDGSHDQIYTLAVSKPATRRIPPPCWSNEETVALIDGYREKWYSLRRGNLRAPDWQEVADGVAARCSNVPEKTSIQCRHKMEKLRKRYRSEIQRIGSGTKGRRCPSSWIHFRLMESMELGTDLSDLAVDLRNQNDDEADDVENDLISYPKGLNRRNQISIAAGVSSGNGNGNRNSNGVRIKIPNFGGMTSAANRLIDDLPPPINPNYGSGGSGKGLRNEVKRKDDGNALDEMVAAIQRLGDGFVKMERMKMEMARELETMRMKAEMKQTELILETQQKMWESFSETVIERRNKKAKRMTTPDS